MDMRYILVLLVLILSLAPLHAAEPELPPGIKNTQDPKDKPLSPQEALKRIEVPDGFEVTLFAGEPDVRQPIAFEFDDRGRLWVAEFYSYRNWQPKGNDRILIFEDTDNDGRFDKRKVFWDKGNYLTGLQLGFGGVWICNAPHLSFIPDRDGDDVPDGEPIVLLDGWGTTGVHNVVNGLTWGPDGWLYGCNGITAPSKVGKPGAPEKERTELSCAIWRFHPTRHEFEVVAHGTTNPWGLDYDQHGQFFFTNCVIGHLWHLIPGAHYQRMFGQDLDPHSYGLITQCADHLHWTGTDWTKARGGERHDSLGGGHAHCGAMIYQGDNWPKEYRGAIYTCNVHGNRVNVDRLKRNGSGYVGQHDKDFFLTHDPWFRGVELKYGPDGSVFVLDWTDLGECHDKDGIHQDSGRIYKVKYSVNKKTNPLKAIGDLSKLSNTDLVDLQTSPNAWYSRRARRILQERAAEDEKLADINAPLMKMLQEEETTHQLRALWTLWATGAIDDKVLAAKLSHKNEHVRWWAVQLLSEDKKISSSVAERFKNMAAKDPSPLVRLALASALQRLPLESRWDIATAMLSNESDADDQNLPLMMWYAMESLVASDSKRALALAVKCKIPLIRQYIARRIVED